MRLEVQTIHRAIIRRPSDMHHHLRDGNMLTVTVPNAARFDYVLAMPNLKSDPVCTLAGMVAYYKRLLSAQTAYAGAGHPLWVMTAYLTETCSAHEVSEMSKAHLHFGGVKFYPRGLTTNADHGPATRDLYDSSTSAWATLRMLARVERPLLMHACDGEDASGRPLDPYDQERHFVQETLPRIRDAHPNLRISLEHLSTVHGCEAVRRLGGVSLGASLTPHHLGQSRRDVFAGGFRPHRFWWPLAQSDEHRQELVHLLDEDRDHVWLGTDSAPHEKGSKEAACCAGGVLMTHPVEMMADLMIKDATSEAQWARLERFVSLNGPRWFHLPVPVGDTLTLVQRPCTVLDTASSLDVVPYRMGETLGWSIEA